MLLAIVAILSTLAALSFTRLVQSNTISSNVNTFMAGLRYARSESTRHGGSVMMCPSDVPEAVHPACDTTSRPDGHGCVSGGIFYLDANNDGVINADDPLRIQPPISKRGSITENDGALSSIFRCTATGRLFNVVAAASLQFGASAYARDMQRVLCVNNTGGRALIVGNGVVSCGTNS